MVEFTQEFRHYCRNPRCRMKLPSPVENVREAFCARGCYEQYYRLHCLACETPIVPDRRGGKRRVCDKSKCRNALHALNVAGGYLPAYGQFSQPKVPVNKGLKLPLSGDRPSFFVAAGKISLNAFHCALVGADWALAENVKANAKHGRVRPSQKSPDLRRGLEWTKRVNQTGLIGPCYVLEQEGLGEEGIQQKD